MKNYAIGQPAKSRVIGIFESNAPTWAEQNKNIITVEKREESRDKSAEIEDNDESHENTNKEKVRMLEAACGEENKILILQNFLPPLCQPEKGAERRKAKTDDGVKPNNGYE